MNRKWLPLWWLKIQYMMSINISFEGNESINTRDMERRSEQLSLLGYEKLEREITITGNRRGYYRIENMDIMCSDLFVTNNFIKKHLVKDSLYVFPKLLYGNDFDIRFRKLLGDVVIKKHLIHDPYERKGIRDYDTYDSLKDINWLASARSTELKVNIYNYTASQQVLIFLSCQKENSWVFDKIIEEGISLAATIYDSLSKQGIKVGLITDCIDTETNKNIVIESGCEIDHSYMFYQCLSKIKIAESCEDNISNYIEKEVLNNNNEPLYIVIANSTRNGIKESIQNAKENDFDVKWVIPKNPKTEIEMEDLDDVIMWDVSI